MLYIGINAGERNLLLYGKVGAKLRKSLSEHHEKSVAVFGWALSHKGSHVGIR
jgi:hypothetical protein